MIKTPNFLKKLMQSDAYSNKSNPDYENANEEVSKYFKTLYPGKMEFDATGRMKEPEFDMTLEQFENAQNQIDADFEEAKEEAAEEIMEEFGEYFENLGIDFDIEQYVIPAETMVVNVLHPGGEILTKDLQFYDLEIPDFEKANKIWTWHCEQSESTCDECAELDGQVFFDKSELPECPIHPNCNCWIEESETDEDGNKIKSKKYAADINKDEKMKTNDEKFETLIKHVKNNEGGYEDKPEKIDQPTNMGIIQKTLDKYNEKHPEYGFSSDLKQLTWQQAEQIYKELYYDEKRIVEINDLRIAYAVMDMGAMTSPKNVGNIVQDSINKTLQDKVVKDGIIGNETIKALNIIPENKKDEFMKNLFNYRMDFLKGLKDWKKYGDGWTIRTQGYLNRNF